MKTVDKVNGFVNKYLTLFVLVVVGIALLVPNLLIPLNKLSFGTVTVGTATFKFSLSSLLLMIVMLGAGTGISTKELVQVAKKPRDLIIGVAAKYVIMALAAYLVALVLGLDSQLAFGLILLGTMPPGTAAAVLVTLAGGEVSFGVAMCVICTLLAPVAAPLLTMLLGGAWVSIDFLSMVLNITIVVLIPVVLGILLKSILKEKITNFKKILTSLCLLSVLIIIGTSTAPNKAVILSMDSIIVIVAVTLNFVIAAAVFFLLAKVLKMDTPRANALIITSSEQNNALAVGIAASFSAVYPAASIPAIIAVALNFILATILTNWLCARAQKAGADTAS